MMPSIKANVGTSKLMQVLQVQAGGYNRVGCDIRDMYNYERDLRDANRVHDAQFFIDNDNSLKLVFWSDTVAQKIAACLVMVLFDTTYETNKYRMIFAPFTGVNRPRQSVTFGVALLNNERIESFTWLFTKFLEAMGGQQPQVIIFDQNPAMMVTIKQVLDKSIHRFCMWHILKKVSEKVSVKLFFNPCFNHRFQSCVWESETPEEFECKWASIVRDFQWIELNG